MRALFRSIAFLTVSYILLANVAGADENKPTETSHIPAIGSTPLGERADFVAAMRGLLAQEKDQLDALQQQLLVETDPVKATEIQRQVRSVKIETEIALLQLQLDRAAKVGKSDLSKKLREAIETLKNPKPHIASDLAIPTPPPSRDR